MNINFANWYSFWFHSQICIYFSSPRLRLARMSDWSLFLYSVCLSFSKGWKQKTQFSSEKPPRKGLLALWTVCSGSSICSSYILRSWINWNSMNSFQTEPYIYLDQISRTRIIHHIWEYGSWQRSRLPNMHRTELNISYTLYSHKWYICKCQ